MTTAGQNIKSKPKYTPVHMARFNSSSISLEHCEVVGGVELCHTDENREHGTAIRSASKITIEIRARSVGAPLFMKID